MPEVRLRVADGTIMDTSTMPSNRSLADVLRSLNRSGEVSFLLDTSLRLTYCNPAWDRFAAENEAPELTGRKVLGTDLIKVIGKELQPFYSNAFEKVASDGKTWEYLYECSSPALFRKFRMRIQAFKPMGFLVTNHRVIERPHPSTVSSGLEGYVNADGIISLCMHCRCSRSTIHPERWDFVPAHLDRGLNNITHGLCPVCLEYFYPKPGDYQN